MRLCISLSQTFTKTTPICVCGMGGGEGVSMGNLQSTGQIYTMEHPLQHVGKQLNLKVKTSFCFAIKIKLHSDVLSRGVLTYLPIFIEIHRTKYTSKVASHLEHQHKDRLWRSDFIIFVQVTLNVSDPIQTRLSPPY